MHIRSPRFAALVCGILVAASLVSCSSSGSGDLSSQAGEKPVTLTIYTGNHKDLVKTLGDAFTEDTGIAVSIRDGEDADLVNQIITEGDHTKADLFLSEEPGPIERLSDAGMLTPIPETDLGTVDPRLIPDPPDWIPYAARSRVIY